MSDSSFERRWWVPALMPSVGLAAGVMFGAATNVVNGSVSPRYFRTIMRWPEMYVWYRSVIQGMLEGGALGFLFGVVVGISFAASTGLRGPMKLAVAALGRAIVVVLVCWVIGGIVAMVLAAAIPLWYRATFIGVPEEFGQRMGYAWVGGSIWGAYGGALAGAILACVWLHLKWTRRPPVPAFDVLQSSQ